MRNHRRNPIIAGEICWPIVDFLGFGADLVAFATAQVFDFIGRSSKIRTYDPHVPNVVLYQAELYSDGGGLIDWPSGGAQRRDTRLGIGWGARIRT